MASSSRRVLMAVHAHPDDECIGTGGVLAHYTSDGGRTVLVTCTGGEVGEISDPNLATPENLAEVRARELAEAVRILGINRAVQLGYRDSGMAGTPDNDHPDSFHQASLEEATDLVVRLIRDERPQVIVTYNETGGYGHPDHIKAHQVAVAAFHAAGDPERFPGAGRPWQPSKLYYTVFPRRRFEQALEEAGIESPFKPPEGSDTSQSESLVETSEDGATTVVDVSAYVDRKMEALLAHRTQVGPGSFFARLPDEVMRRVWSDEFFQRVVPTAGPGERETNLFQGL